MERKFYSCSVGEKDKGYDEENLKRIINNRAFILHENTSQKGVYLDIKPNDILLLKYRGNFIAYGEALDIKKTSDEEWNLFAPVKDWYFYDIINPSFGTEIYGMKNATLGGSQYGTVKPLEDKFSLKKIKNIKQDTELFKIIKNEFLQEKKSKKMHDKIDLLEYKKQIILQGPPGTGKTRLAKMIAEKMTKAEKKSNPEQLIDDFFKSFTLNDNIQNHRKVTEVLLTEFINKFKIEELKNLSLENYALGREDKDGFCYWLEYILSATGKYTGRADKGKIYYNKANDIYIKSGFLKPEKDDLEAMKKMNIVLDKVVNESFDEGYNFPIGKGFILKILNTYFPEKYFPINSEHCLDNALKLFGVTTFGMNYIDKNKKLQSLFLEKKKEFDVDVTNYEFMYFLFNNFNLKKEIKLDGNELIVEGKYKILQFHPSYSYEDFVRGISAKTNENGDINYCVENRILTELANEALDNPKSKYILIIDEINRANLSSVLGELIYALEYRFNHEKNNNKEASVESIYNIALNEEETDRVILLPDNLYIIGTMNTADRSIGHIDYAIKRRFAFVNVLPEIEPVHPLIKDIFIKVSNLFIKNFDGLTIPKYPESSDSLAADFKPEDVWIGHSYFICKKTDLDENEEDDKAKPILNMKLKYEIIPLLKEYIKDGILNETEQVKKVMDELISKDFTK